MSLISFQGQDDPRATYQLLAASALECIENPSEAQKHRAILSQMYRLLDMYRFDAYPSDDPPGILLALSENPEQDVASDNAAWYGPVKEALEGARRAVYKSNDAEEASQALQRVLTFLVASENEARELHVQQKDLQRAMSFFKDFSHRLDQPVAR